MVELSLEDEIALLERRKAESLAQGSDEDAAFYEQLLAVKQGRASVFQPSTALLPRWVRQTGSAVQPAIDDFVCDDPGEMSFALRVGLTTGFSIPEFDLWLDSIGLCGAREELMIRREQAGTALHENKIDAVYRHLEWLSNRRRGIERELALLPLAKTGEKVRKPMAAARAERIRQSAANIAQWQARALELWAMAQHSDKCAFDIARLIDPQHSNTIRRKIRRT